MAKSLHDAAQEVRNVGREAFLLYRENFSENADRIFKTLDAQIKRAIQQSDEGTTNYRKSAFLDTQKQHEID